MKQLLAFIFCVAFFSSCQESTDAGVTSSKPGTIFNDRDVINEVNDGLANSTVAQVDLRNILQGKKETTVQTTVPVASLQSVFPEQLNGLDRHKLGGEQNSILGHPCTFSSAEYRNVDGTQVVRIAITDTGGDPRSILGLCPWAVQVVNKDEETFYERTRTFGGFPAHERFIPSSQVSNFDYVVNKRYVVTIHGRNLPIETIHKMAGFVKPRTLIKLK